MVTASRNPVSESRWGWVAVPDVGEEGTNGAQIVMWCFPFVFISPLFVSRPLLVFESPIAMHDPWWR